MPLMLILLFILLTFALGSFLLYKMIHNPIWGVAIVLMAKPFEFIFQNLGGFTVGRIVGLLTTFIWLFHLARSQYLSERFSRSTLIKKIALYVLAALFSGMVWSFEPDGEKALYESVTIMSLALLALMLENFSMQEDDIKLVARAMALASVLASIPALLYTVGIDVYTPLGADSPMDISEESLRASTLGGNPNSLGISARNGIFALLVLISFRTSRIERIMILSSIFILLAGIFLSGSRTNFYGTFILLFTVGFFSTSHLLRKPRMILGLATLLVVGFAAYQITPDPVKVRLLMGQGDERIARRASNRVDFTLKQQGEAMEYLGDYPLFGIGMNRTYYMSDYGYAAHDTFSVIVGETGLLGILGFVIIIAWSIGILLRVILRSGPSILKFRFSVLLGMIISMFMMGILGGFIVPYDRAFWIVLGFIPYFLSSLQVRNDFPTVHSEHGLSVVNQNHSKQANFS